MSISSFCIQQRQQEQQKLKKLLAVGLVGSAALHGVLAFSLSYWSPKLPTAEKPIELMIVEQPQPEPKPEPKPEPVKTETPPAQIKEPEPVKPRPAPPAQIKEPEPVKPQPALQKVLTSPEPPAPSQPTVSAPIEESQPAPQPRETFTEEASSPDDSVESSDSGVPGGVAANTEAPPRPEPSSSEGIACVSNCQPQYPSALDGAEGSAGVRITIDSNGNVASAAIANAHSNTELNRQALLAAREMQFTPPSGGGSASVLVKINFTVAGSDFDRQARQRQEQAERERQRQERERQAQQERERQARQEQLERERQERARQQQLEQQRQAEIEPQQPQPQQAPARQPQQRPQAEDDEMLRQFRERIERYQRKQQQ